MNSQPNAPNSQPNAPGPIRLLLVEDHAQVAMALVAAFETVEDIDLVGTAGTIAEAVSLAAELGPDLVLLDRRLPDGDGVDAIAPLREHHPSGRVLIFTGEADRAIADRVRAAGGDGLVLKAGRLDNLLSTIHRVAAGEQSFDVGLLEQ
ncbi:response regulator [Microlunatus soli]|uniref:Response regulator receiver domain-containing protein n=1 Tax=Microlunatus soli TaxID=630515 RepID=A0A1H1Z823_9ACTN|nr:response regulator transcription factor [Microlunatus soli]SDT29921.1 Response regulator receiver domain-containing protein [Microlunatus soli]